MSACANKSYILLFKKRLLLYRQDIDSTSISQWEVNNKVMAVRGGIVSGNKRATC